MANADRQLYGAINPGNIAVGTGTNATAAATQAAPPAGQCLLITKIIISASAAAAAAVKAVVQHGAGPTTMFSIDIPAAAIAPIIIDFGTHPIALAEAEQAVVSVPALGSGVICDVALFTVASST